MTGVISSTTAVDQGDDDDGNGNIDQASDSEGEANGYSKEDNENQNNIDNTLSLSSDGACGTSITINRSHGLFGMWEGSFDVRSPDGLVPVAEKFFFHALAGKSVPAGLECLPPTDWWMTAHLLKHMNIDGAVVFGRGDEDASSNIYHGLSENHSLGSVISAPINIEYNEIEGIINNADESSNKNSPIVGDNNIPESAPQIEANQDTSGVAVEAVIINTAVTHKDLDYILGFGRNIFGRFSLFGVYDIHTDEFKCERKYLLSKTSGLKKHSKIVTSFYSNESGGPLSGTHSASDSLRTSSRTHKISKHFGGGDDFVAIPPPNPRISIGNGQRSRSGSATHNNNYNSTSIASVDVLPVAHLSSLKRKRSQSEVSFSGVGTSSISTTPIRNKGSSSVHDHPSKSEIKATHAPSINYHDVHDKTERYRSVFFDENLGSYYEGWWAFGNRHGEGVCLYADKTLYEGHWNLGREHGKGALMTADRKDIYRGEWVDGVFHGHGTYTFPNGDVYSGDWREGNRHGKGEYKISSLGCSYIGDFRENKRYD